MTNPLLASHTLPPFSAISAEQVTPAISELIAQGRAQLAQLLADLPAPGWDTLVAPLEEQGDKLDRSCYLSRSAMQMGAVFFLCMQQCKIGSLNQCFHRVACCIRTSESNTYAD